MALIQAQGLLLGEFWAKALSKEGTKERNAELAAEARAIEREEARGDEGELEIDKI